MEDGEHIIGPIKANNGSEREENSNSQSHTRDKTQSHLDGEEPLMAHIHVKVPSRFASVVHKYFDEVRGV